MVRASAQYDTSRHVEERPGPLHAALRLTSLDALRGVALGGICLANLTSFAGVWLMTLGDPRRTDASAKTTLFLIDWLIEGKCYALFALLFGVGFHRLASKAWTSRHAFHTFWARRMGCLVVVGIVHLFMMWNGDILTLYACVGIGLPLVRHLPDHVLIRVAAVLFVLPIGMQCLVTMTNHASEWGSLARVAADVKASWGLADRSIFSMRLSSQWWEVVASNVLGAIERPMTYLMTGRPFQVMGQFLLGLWIGRQLFSGPTHEGRWFERMRWWALVVGLSLNAVYAVIKMETGAAFAPGAIGLLQSLVYHGGSTLLALGYAATIVGGLECAPAQSRTCRLWSWFVPLGRMPLSVYLLQSLVGLVIFYGYGLGLSGAVPIVALPALAATIVGLQRAGCVWWLQRYGSGPIERIWRRVAYGYTTGLVGRQA
ncbi:MAG: DUF418 domain-containing protein [Nitrospiraceae bacterium]